MELIRRIAAKFTNEDRMNITDPDWKEDVERERSYGKVGKTIIIVGIVVFVGYFGLYMLADKLDCTVWELFHKVWHHIFPHVQTDGKDILNS